VIAAPDIDFPNMTELGGYFSDIGTNLRQQNQFSPYNTAAAEEYVASLREQLSPEARRARRQEDMWSMLGQIGARMASTPGSLLQAVSAGLGEAVPTTAAAARERRAEERQLRESILGEERTGNRERAERFAVARDMLNNFNSLDEARKNRSFEALFQSLTLREQRDLALARMALDRELGQMGLAGTLGSARITATSGLERERTALRNSIIGLITEEIGPGGTQELPYMAAVRDGTVDDFIANRSAVYSRMFGLSPTPRPGIPTPPAGAVRPRE
jgi:hypothetical protein